LYGLGKILQEKEMKGDANIISARKRFDELAIERRDLQKELQEIKTEIEEKLAGRSTPRPFVELKKREAEITARLADLPGLLIDARDGLAVALKEGAAQLTAEGEEAINGVQPEIAQALSEMEAACATLEKTLQGAAAKIAALTGESAGALDAERLLTEAGQIFAADRDAGFIGRLKNRIDYRLHDAVTSAAARLRYEGDRLRYEAIR